MYICWFEKEKNTNEHRTHKTDHSQKKLRTFKELKRDTKMEMKNFVFFRSCQMHNNKRNMFWLFTIPEESYTVLTSILNEPTTVPDLKNFLEWITYEEKKKEKEENGGLYTQTDRNKCKCKQNKCQR